MGPALRDKALSLQADYQDLAPERKTVSEMKDFVKKLNTLPEMNRHTNIADILSKVRLALPHLFVLSVLGWSPLEACDAFSHAMVATSTGDTQHRLHG